MAANLIHSITEQAFADNLFACSGFALSFQRRIIATTCAFCVVLSSWPIIFQDYMQCFCAPENPLKDILETSCLKGVMFTNSTGDETLKQTHEAYRNMPYIFIWFLIVNLLPSVFWQIVDNKVVVKLMEGMKNYNQKTENSRVNRLMNFLSDDLYQISRLYILRSICTILCLLSLIYQTAFWENNINSAFSIVVQYMMGINDNRQQAFPDEVYCSVSKTSFTGREESENFFFYLTMNELFKNLFQVVWIGS